MLILIFLISIIGIILNRTHTILILICIELMLLSITLNFLVNSILLTNITGQIYSLYIITVAAVETAIGLSILITFYKVRGSISVNLLNLLKG
uniref:NADH dehydrogenase subunit 4L n=1 Tax=Agalma elegans TaxID=316166 RepID=UPI0026E18CCF|nr:NADH dehydrogenase subunit 4L [Agalma elegans]WJJ70167.1 NADH dehydrogenase subunit 4L [Agalma elegans]WJJ70252.1 NADH dehydrogenase subunit 4L [Agalma elegans]